ncbi:MAG: 50S ribosomal protein L21 [Candidatus Coatesbacteria bacterium 4484_99]|uniref:Large ribosomal subunit protein bL21 n=1 Tax=Candidatus Coatesbacteria bacterium 4484_99 TaxID=1970774 RepID=A0A1W9S306_9BACT|nr:MAG: 50S ribosomal protein L21 [Candidatus Coatesbacteria bacterium 4484_99]RLC39700.1 MAG: 50S ribosomal protein L21 [Candidatus Coatesbacteria bacterium]RLC41664.1 MAG: 50S ribosomal protein L21 [Candidatus Coatesbacteria bacterium]RLC42245.1 MAG: 50S ribosomal protein L21 [Candidatus Coatesbacteria bacterium]
MKAIVEIGGTQHIVEIGQEIVINRVEVPVGDDVVCDRVLGIIEDGDKVKVGKPVIEKSKVVFEVAEHIRGPKVIAFKFKKRKDYHKKKGHRQDLTRLKVKDIKV